MSIGESHAPLCEPVEIWRVDSGFGVVAGYVAIAHVINEIEKMAFTIGEGKEINDENIELLKGNNIDKIVIFDIDHIHIGSYLANTFNIEKNDSRLTALLDIYKILRPGEPPSLL